MPGADEGRAPAGLWNEVGDALGLVLVYQSQLDTTDERVALLERAVATRGVPWRALPKLWFIDGGDVGRLHVGQKGGCCLAYTEPGAVATRRAVCTARHAPCRDAGPRVPPSKCNGGSNRAIETDRD